MKYILMTLIIFLTNSIAMDNLETCLSGKFSSLCNYGLLTTEQRKMAREAERIENLNTCLSGKFPSLCKYSLLSSNELKQVKEAERIENLQTCLSGKYKSLCKHHLLTTDEKIQVKKAEEAENLKICLDGNFPSLCNYSQLTSEQKAKVKNAENRVKNISSSKTMNIQKPINPYRRVNQCESGHWIDSNEQNGEIIILEDGSVWEISDTLDSFLWLPLTSITVCPYSLINTDDNEQVDAYRLK
jgi:hypothetical protein